LKEEKPFSKKRIRSTKDERETKDLTPNNKKIRQLAKNMEGGSKDMINTKDKDRMYPLHLACRGGASVEVIRYLVEDVEGGKDMINAKDKDGMYPLHWACRGGASVEVIRYLVKNMEGGKDMINAKDGYGMYPLHYACRGRASVEVIRYLVEDVEGGKDMINAQDDDGRYPLHFACLEGASVEMIRYLIRCRPKLTTVSDNQGSTPVDYLDPSKGAKLFGGFITKTGMITDKPSTIDKLGYSMYARALAKSVRMAEKPESSLCVGLYGMWGSGKSTLWKHIVKHLNAEFQTDDAHYFQEQCDAHYLEEQCYSHSYGKMNATEKCCKKAYTEVLKSSNISANQKNLLNDETIQKDNSLPFLKFFFTFFTFFAAVLKMRHMIRMRKV